MYSVVTNNNCFVESIVWGNYRTIVETILVETMIVETILVETMIVETIIVETMIVETMIVETMIVETIFEQGKLKCGNYLVSNLKISFKRRLPGCSIILKSAILMEPANPPSL
jgi:hypothetical protein